MRLSEAIILGATTCKLTAGDINSCAIGCALNAAGVAKDLSVYPRSRWKEYERLWPWTEGGMDGSHSEWIWMDFDHLVCRGQMTLEQLADKVRAAEPNCDCNRFDCNCAQTAEQVTEVLHAQEA